LGEPCGVVDRDRERVEPNLIAKRATPLRLTDRALLAAPVKGSARPAAAPGCQSVRGARHRGQAARAVLAGAAALAIGACGALRCAGRSTAQRLGAG
jgi:nitrous oxidase accessory protein NosD